MSWNAPTPPTTEEVLETAAAHHIDLTADEAEAIASMVRSKLSLYERLDDHPDPRRPPSRVDRHPGHVPDADDDPLNAFVTRCHIDGGDGPLSDYGIGIKDNVSVACVEMTCGSASLAGYVPLSDATVVGRLLDAGATVTGKTNMGDMAVSGSYSATGPILNPRDTEYLAGGSSGGSAAAVVRGDVDAALGTDQGGSIRVPAAWCGCVGHKPTYGLVPYTGVVSLGATFDHVGPLARSAEDCALLLDVLAGADGFDPRQAAVAPADYRGSLAGTPEGITVGVLEEGFDVPGGNADVDDAVFDALDAFERQGADTGARSIPLHDDGIAIWTAIAAEEVTATIRDDGLVRALDGWFDTQFGRAMATARRSRADEFPPNLKSMLVLGQYMMDEHHGQYYAKARNLCHTLGDAYDRALEDVDVLAMPTSSVTATRHRTTVSFEAAIGDVRGADRSRLGNTMPFNVTGHPAISVPCGTVDGLPVGVMFVGDHFADDTVLAAAHAFERTVDRPAA